MADEKILTNKLTNELLSEDQLENVAGGYRYDGKSPTITVATLMSDAIDFQFKVYEDKENEYFLDGQQITRDEAFAEYQKLFDKGYFNKYVCATRDSWNWKFVKGEDF